MFSGFGFIDILVSEITMVIGALIFLLCGTLLIFKRKTLNSSQKALVVGGLVVTAIYLAFIIYLVVMWG
ncbi:MAG: hypothetical protein IJF15_03160 [Oscillospiraceae bacterium]|nr:hypothetical protein [Oscillospiraceae bacterium]